MNNNIQRIKIINGKNGDAIADYGKVLEPFVFRYSLLKNILQSADTDVTLIVDTNLRTGDQPAMLDEQLLRQMGLPYAIIPAKPNPHMFFGIHLNTQPGVKTAWSEQRMILELTGSGIPIELLKATAHYDLSLGFGRKLPFEEICQACRAGGSDLLFNPCFFSDSLYDSVICTRLRSTFPLEQYIEAVSNEMAL